jgi:hypothetical protein
MGRLQRFGRNYVYLHFFLALSRLPSNQRDQRISLVNQLNNFPSNPSPTGECTSNYETFSIPSYCLLGLLQRSIIWAITNRW